MAYSHKCIYCGRYTTKGNECYVGNRQYAHKECYAFKKECEKRIDSFSVSKFKKQLRELVDNGRDINGLTKALEYWYDEKGNSSQRANGGIAILDYVYDEAQEYFQKKKERARLASGVTDEQKKAYQDIWKKPLAKTPKQMPFRKPIGVHYIDMK